jgi:hypothetical protein
MQNVKNSSKSGWHPHPIHGQPDAVLSEAASQKLVFFASFFKILTKREAIILPKTLVVRKSR